MVAHARRNRLGVYPWTVNDGGSMDALLELGVDGIVTDFPDHLDDALASAPVERSFEPGLSAA